MLTPGGSPAITFILIVFEFTVELVAHLIEGSIVRIQFTTSPSTIDEEVNKLLLVPTLPPLTCHWYEGAFPVYETLAEKFTGVPAQIVFEEVVMLIVGETTAVTTMLIELETTGAAPAEKELSV